MNSKLGLGLALVSLIAAAACTEKKSGEAGKTSPAVTETRPEPMLTRPAEPSADDSFSQGTSSGNHEVRRESKSTRKAHAPRSDRRGEVRKESSKQ